MKTEKKILFAFILNLLFSVFEFFGGIYTGSVAILSDAVHDICDAVGIGTSYFLERKSKRSPDERYTYGYARFSVLGSLIVTTLLLIGSAFTIYHALCRLFAPTPIDYDGMILFAIIGVFVNGGAAFFTHGGHSLNQKAVNLHLLEDVLGWLVVLLGAVLMRFTDLPVIDPLLSVGVGGFILYGALKNLKKAGEIFLEKAPKNIDIALLKEELLKVDGVTDVHHVHLWSLDGEANFATMHIVTKEEKIAPTLREILRAHGVLHATLEFETEHCGQAHCHIEHSNHCGHHH